MQKPLKKSNAEIKNSVVEDDIEVDYSDDNDDEELICMVEERIKNHDKRHERTYTWEEMLEQAGITQEELDSMEDVEIE